MQRRLHEAYNLGRKCRRKGYTAHAAERVMSVQRYQPHAAWVKHFMNGYGGK